MPGGFPATNAAVPFPLQSKAPADVLRDVGVVHGGQDPDLVVGRVAVLLAQAREVDLLRHVEVGTRGNPPDRDTGPTTHQPVTETLPG